jgi:hypothetical protein
LNNKTADGKSKEISSAIYVYESTEDACDGWKKRPPIPRMAYI